MLRKSIFVLCLILTLSLLGCSSSNDPVNQSDSLPTTDGLAVHFIDVGQGDSTFIQLPNGQCMLIDAGKNGDGAIVVGYLRQHQIHKIDYLVGTHPHEDHIGGLDDVIDNFDIGKFYMPKITHTTKTFRDVMAAAQSKGLKITPAKAGVEILNQSGLIIEILSPLQNEYDQLNNYSAVIKITYGDHRWLFTGDAEELAEQEMINSNKNVRADILKVGHHGSNTSSSGQFLQRVNPQWAVISVGKDNDYGHPHQEVMERLQQAAINILRTDVQGTITMTSDGTELQIKPGKEQPLVAKKETGKYVGSINSDKYHLPNCSHVQSISPKNIIWFNSLTDAQQAGYHPCSNLQ